MRILVMALAALALLAVPAEAQMGGRKGPKADDSKPIDQNKQKADDKAYQDALKRIPEPKEKYDPWGVAKKPSQ